MAEKFKRSPITIMKKSIEEDDDDNETNDVNATDDGKGPIDSLDEIIDSKLKVGFFHYRLLFVCGLVSSL